MSPRLPKVPPHWSIAAVVFSVFLTASAVMYLTTRNSFYFFDLPFIGTSVALGIVFGRRIAQLLVGAYFLFFLCLTLGVNMQVEGLFFQVLGGSFTAAFVHYMVAKIAGPLVFGRGFCAYGCWTAALLDFLPWTRSPGRKKGWGAGRFVHLGLAFVLVAVLFFAFGMRQPPGAPSSVPWFLVGIGVYYVAGIALAWGLKDNRAFCKYLCPVAPILKAASPLSLLKVRLDPAKCTSCRACEKACPMDVPILAAPAPRHRVGSTECILCGTCIGACRTGALKNSFR